MGKVKKTGLWILILTCVLAAGCNHKEENGKGMQEPVKNMANNDSLQRKFSEGRINTIKDDQESKMEILQNTMEEQKMMLTDNKLRHQLLDFNVNVNKLMTNNPSGKEQLIQSTLEVMEGIGADSDARKRFTKQQNDIRQKALQNSSLKNTILKQNVREQHLALVNTGTAKEMKQISLDTSKSIFFDDELRLEMLKMDIQRFKTISDNPALRTEMAHSMLPLLKDPVIAAELNKMIKLALAQEMKKMQAEMQRQMQNQMMQMKQIQRQTKNPGISKEPSGQPKPAPQPYQPPTNQIEPSQP